MNTGTIYFYIGQINLMFTGKNDWFDHFRIIIDWLLMVTD